MRNILKQGLKRFARARTERPRGDRSAIVLAVAARKGGVGKTTTAVNLGAALARFHGMRTLLVDLDPQNHVARSLGSQFRSSGRGVSSIFAEDDDVDVIDLVAATEAPNLHVVPPDDGLADVESALTTRIGKEFVLREALEVARTHYDLIVVDCPPNVGNLTLNALVAADQVLIPCDVSPLSVDGVHSLIDTVTRVAERLNPRVDVLGIVITRFDARTTSMNDAVTEALDAAYGDVVIPVRIGLSTDLAKAQLAGKNVFDFAPGSRGAAHHRDLAQFVAAQLST